MARDCQLLFGSPPETRTQTERLLKPSPLPIGLESHGTQCRTRTYGAKHVKLPFLPLN